MIDDALPPDEDDAAGIPVGPRRSTYTPPPGGIRWEPPAPDGPVAPPEAAPAEGGAPTTGVAEVGGEAEAGAPAPETRSTPGAVPPPPVRRSLTDAELLAAADPTSADADSGALLDLVERQLELRRTEAAELAAWERTVVETAPEQAPVIVAAVREQFRDIVPPVSETAPSSSTAANLPADPAVAVPPSVTEVPSPPSAGAFAAPSFDLALADAPPPWGQVPSAVVPPPSAAEAAAPASLGSPDSAESPASPESPGSPASLGSPESPASPGSPASIESPPAPGETATSDSSPELEPDLEPGPAVPPPLIEPVPPSGSAGSPPLPPDAALGLFDALLREPEPDAAEPGPEPAADDAQGVSDVAPAVAVDATGVDPIPVPADDPALLLGFTPEDAQPTALEPSALEPSALEPRAVEPSPASDDNAATDAELAVPAPVNPRALRREVVALEPTPAEQRAGRSIRMFWLWFAVNASVVSVALGAVILGLGLSLRQAILAALIGVALSFLPLGLGTLAGKWSGQPTMVVSRATFGTAGNAIPAVVALLTRVAWAAALLWMLGAGIAEIVVGAGLVPDGLRTTVALSAAGAGLVVVAVIAGLGFGAIVRVAAVVSALSAVLVIGLIALTVPFVDLDAALSLPDGDWMLMLGGGVVVFSVVGLAWAMSAGDVARYQARGTSGSATLLWTALGATIPAFALVAWGAVLAASSPVLAEGLQQNPLDLISRLLPLWYPAPLIAAVALSLIAAAALALYSGGFALLAVGIRAPRWAGVLVAVVLTGAIAAALLLVVLDTAGLLRDVLTTLAVPVAAWAGIFAAETMIRTHRVHSPSLLRHGGVYPAVRWVNTLMLLIATGLGWGLTTAAITGLTWQGYLLGPLGVPLDGPIAQADLGVLVALALGLLTPIVAGIPALRKLQTAEKAAAEADLAADSSVVQATGPVAAPTAAPTLAPTADPTPAP